MTEWILQGDHISSLGSIEFNAPLFIILAASFLWIVISSSRNFYTAWRYKRWLKCMEREVQRIELKVAEMESTDPDHSRFTRYAKLRRADLEKRYEFFRKSG